MIEGKGESGKKRAANLLLLTCFAGLGYLLYLVFRPFLSSLIWATVLTVVFSPIFEFVLGRMKDRRTPAALATCLLVLLLFVMPVIFFGVVVTQQSVVLYRSIESNIGVLGQQGAERLQEFQQRPWVRQCLELATRWTGSGEVDLKANTQQAIGSLSKFTVGLGASLLKGAGGLVFGLFIVFITMFFLLRDGPHILEFMAAMSPLPAAYSSAVLAKFRDISFATFYGTILTAAVQGAVGGLILWLLGIPSPLFWAAVVSLVSLVPIVGTFIVWIPMSAYLMLAGQTTKGIMVLVLGGAIVASIDNLLKPIIIRGRTDMHPLLVFLSVLGGMQVFGFLGVLLGPLTVAVFLAFLNLYRLDAQEQ